MDLLNNVKDELDEMSQALTAVVCAVQLMKHPDDDDLVELARSQARRAVHSHRRLVRLVRLMQEANDAL